MASFSNRSVPDAPLNWGDEADHRRLIALRANAIGYETGPFTPTFDFATPGDLSNSYGDQEGLFWRIGPLVHFTLKVAVTPTHTTSSGEAQIGGFPYAAASPQPSVSVFPVRLDGTNITWPLSDVVGFMRDQEQFMVLAFQGSLDAGQAMAAADIASANSLSIFASGFYPIND